MAQLSLLNISAKDAIRQHLQALRQNLPLHGHRHYCWTAPSLPMRNTTDFFKS
jgi:hypothetical protein